MDQEVWVALLAVFVSGGAVGTAGTLLAQWLLKRLDGAPASPRERLDAAEVDVLRTEVAELGRHLRNLDARLDFTERLLDGALPLAPPPTRLPGAGPAAAAGQPGGPRPESA
jgi:hypothetical protein